jgi:hypothetical protein
MAPIERDCLPFFYAQRRSSVKSSFGIFGLQENGGCCIRHICTCEGLDDLVFLRGPNLTTPVERGRTAGNQAFAA